MRDQQFDIAHGKKRDACGHQLISVFFLLLLSISCIRIAGVKWLNLTLLTNECLKT